MAFLSDVARIAVLKGAPGVAPPLLERDGRPAMVVVVATILYPLCLQRHIREVGLGQGRERWRIDGAYIIEDIKLPYGYL